MVEILEELHKYVPTKQTTKEFDVVHSDEEVERILVRIHHFYTVFLGGDYLTAARARGAQRIRNNSENGTACLEGLFPVSEDWHTKLCLLKVLPNTCIYVAIPQ